MAGIEKPTHEVVLSTADNQIWMHLYVHLYDVEGKEISDEEAEDAVREMLGGQISTVHRLEEG
mgnify:CR=1 FL=1